VYDIFEGYASILGPKCGMHSGKDKGASKQGTVENGFEFFKGE